MLKKFAIPLVRTKLFIPQDRAERVRRPRLIKHLNNGLSYPLILLSSLPGSGKTTTLSDWIGQLSVPAVWVSLESSDNDPARFFRYFIAALQSIFPTIGRTSLEELDFTDLLSFEIILNALINDLSEQAVEFVLVLDDFHVIHNPLIQSAIASYIDHQPSHAHLVIATRADPGFPLSRLRTRNKILEMRIDELRFTDVEISEYLSQIMGLNLSKEDLSVLTTRTEGWIASLQMTALSLKHAVDPKGFIQAFSGSNRYVMDYLVEEVLDLQPENVQNFLLQTSILERLNGPLCDAVCSGNRARDEQTSVEFNHASRGQEMLEFLERSNLFIVPLDQERKWYRYHHLFSSLLRVRLGHSKIGPLDELHLRAADWFEQNGYIEDAIRHALTGQDFPRAARLIEQIAESAWLSGQYSRLTEWIQALPQDLVLCTSWLCIWSAWSFTQTGIVKKANAWIEAAEEAVRKQAGERAGEGAYSLGFDNLEYQITALKVLIACLEQDYDRALKLAVPILGTPPPQGKSSLIAQCHIYHGLNYKYFTDGNLKKAEQTNLETIRLSKEIGFTLRQLHGTNKLIFVYKTSGQLRKSYQLIRNTLNELQEQGLTDYFAAGTLRCRLVDLLYEWDRLEDAGREIENHLKPELAVGVPYLLVDFYNIRARKLLLEKDFSGAQSLLDTAFTLIHQSFIWNGLAWQTEALQIRLWLLTDNLAATTNWATGLSPIPAGTIPFSIESREICRGRVLLATGNFSGAIDLLDQLEFAAKAGERWGSLVEINTLLAVALLGAGQLERAVAALEQALKLAEPEGYVRTIITEGQPVAQLLAHIAREQRERHSPYAPYARRLLEKIELENKEDTDRVITSALIEPLSKREVEVLRCMAAGLSNLETARQLVIETATVKRHIHTIFAKLEVTNRVQAVNIAKTYKII